jgi:hypothetical protein
MADYHAFSLDIFKVFESTLNKMALYSKYLQMIPKISFTAIYLSNQVFILCLLYSFLEISIFVWFVIFVYFIGKFDILFSLDTILSILNRSLHFFICVNYFILIFIWFNCCFRFMVKLIPLLSEIMILCCLKLGSLLITKIHCTLSLLTWVFLSSAYYWLERNERYIWFWYKPRGRISLLWQQYFWFDVHQNFGMLLPD